MNWKHIVAGLVGFALGFYVCMPREMTLQERWEVLVVDAAGHGLAGTTVTQVRQDFATGQGKSASRQIADTYGRAAFPAIHIRSSPLLRGLSCIRQKSVKGISSPCGFTQQIAAAVDGYAETTREERRLPLQGRGRLLRIMMRSEH